MTTQMNEPAPVSNETADSNHEDKLVPVSEAIRYRKRAQTAEQQLEVIQQELEQMQQSLEASQQTITALERRQRIDQLLNEANPIDLEAARLLTEVTVSQMDKEDVAEAVADLRRHKPYLFRRTQPTTKTMSARIDDVIDAADDAAEQAARSGDRRDLLHYLRLRRKP